jgi:predicted dehydrogenase
VLLAGTGSIGRRHAHNLQLLRPDVSFALLRDGAREDDYSAAIGASVFADLQQALAWQPDLAVVATPSDRHHEIVGPLLAAGVAALLEKPIVTEQLQVETLLPLLPGAPPTQVGCVLRFLPSLRRVRKWLDGGAIGKVVRASLEVGQWLPDWRPSRDYRTSYSASAQRGGGVVLDLVHEIDLACWLFGADRLLGAWGAHRSSLEIDAEDVAVLALSNADGMPMTVQLDYVARPAVRRLHAVGDEGTIHWDLPARRCVLQRPGQPDESADGFDTARAYVDATVELLDAVECGTSTSLPLEEGLRATQLAIAANALIRRSAALV